MEINQNHFINSKGIKEKTDLQLQHQTLAKKGKIYKKKEQLADGLHLIDFEQLKIEN